MPGLEVYHLRLSQSERIVWLMEELQIPYELFAFDRNPETALNVPEIKDKNPMGTAPFLRDKNVEPTVELGESGAIVQYIIEVYGPRSSIRLDRKPGDPDYASYLQWFHFSNGSLQPTISRNMGHDFSTSPSSLPLINQVFLRRMMNNLKVVDTQLSKTKYLAGNELTAADIMTGFTLSTMRGFVNFELGKEEFGNVLRWLRDIGEREGYRRAMRKGDPGLEPMLGEKVGVFDQFPMFSRKK